MNYLFIGVYKGTEIVSCISFKILVVMLFRQVLTVLQSLYFISSDISFRCCEWILNYNLALLRIILDMYLAISLSNK